MTDEHDDLPLLTQRQAAKLAGVAPRTFRGWGIEPAERQGRSPLYRWEDIEWERDRRIDADNNSAREIGRQELEDMPCGGNIFRCLLQDYHHVSLQALATWWRCWLDDGSWREVDGLTEAQAREVCWRALTWSSWGLTMYLTEGFEKYMVRNQGIDLDELAARLLHRHMSTTWDDPDVLPPIPEAISELMPADVASRLEELSR